MLPRMQRIFPLLLLLVSLNAWSADRFNESLFHYQESARTNLEIFPQWLSVLDRHRRSLQSEARCDVKRYSRCYLEDWLTFLDSLKGMGEMEQIRKVNAYANSKQYVFDSENYGVEDYWASPGEFLVRNGDCEDYAIIKMISLLYLGFDADRMRVVIVQDTNQRIAHAVMSMKAGGDILILDNQIEEVISHKYIYHYVPVYSINEKSWWMHLPN